MFFLPFVRWVFFFFSSRRRHTRSDRDWSSDVCSSDLERLVPIREIKRGEASQLMAAKAEWPANASSTLLSFENVSKVYTIRRSGMFGGTAGAFTAVDNVSLTIE